MHLVGFIIRIFHDVRSPERQNRKLRVHLFLLCITTTPALFGLVFL